MGRDVGGAVRSRGLSVVGVDDQEAGRPTGPHADGPSAPPVEMGVWAVDAAQSLIGGRVAGRPSRTYTTSVPPTVRRATVGPPNPVAGTWNRLSVDDLPVPVPGRSFGSVDGDGVSTSAHGPGPCGVAGASRPGRWIGATVVGSPPGDRSLATPASIQARAARVRGSKHGCPAMDPVRRTSSLMASTRQCSGSNFWLVDRALLRLQEVGRRIDDHLVPIEPDPPRRGQASETRAVAARRLVAPAEQRASPLAGSRPPAARRTHCPGRFGASDALRSAAMPSDVPSRPATPITSPSRPSRCRDRISSAASESAPEPTISCGHSQMSA